MAWAAFSGFDTIQRVSARPVSCFWGKPSVEMKPGSTFPTCTPFGFSSR